MNNRHLAAATLLAGLSLLGCDGQQYVNPETVRLTIHRDSGGSVRVDACNYVPILLGSQVEKSYPVDGTMDATITITRSDIVVTFQGSDEDFGPFRVAPQDLEAGSIIDDDPPTGYAVELGSGCAPDVEL